MNLFDRLIITALVIAAACLTTYGLARLIAPLLQ